MCQVPIQVVEDSSGPNKVPDVVNFMLHWPEAVTGHTTVPPLGMTNPIERNNVGKGLASVGSWMETSLLKRHLQRPLNVMKL